LGVSPCAWRGDRVVACVLPRVRLCVVAVQPPPPRSDLGGWSFTWHGEGLLRRHWPYCCVALPDWVGESYAPVRRFTDCKQQISSEASTASMSSGVQAVALYAAAVGRPAAPCFWGWPQKPTPSPSLLSFRVLLGRAWAFLTFLPGPFGACLSRPLSQAAWAEAVRELSSGCRDSFLVR